MVSGIHRPVSVPTSRRRKVFKSNFDLIGSEDLTELKFDLYSNLSIFARLANALS
jgi:hypothetical protein